MQKALDKVKQLQIDMGYFEKTQNNKTFKMDYIRDICLALNVEVVEFLQELPWKPWSDDPTLDYTREPAAKELADGMVFLLVLWVTLNPKANIDEVMELTFNKIGTRIKDKNYGNRS